MPTVTPGRVPVGAWDETVGETRAEMPVGVGVGVAVEAGGAAPRQRPLHPEDPYGTPPYGGPGPWAPAPPVQRPVLPAAHGAVPPPPAGPLPAYGAPAPAVPGALPPQAPMPGASHPGGAGISVPPAQPMAAPGAAGDGRSPAEPGGDPRHPAGAADAYQAGTADAYLTGTPDAYPAAGAQSPRPADGPGSRQPEPHQPEPHRPDLRKPAPGGDPRHPAGAADTYQAGTSDTYPAGAAGAQSPRPTDGPGSPQPEPHQPDLRKPAPAQTTAAQTTAVLPTAVPPPTPTPPTGQEAEAVAGPAGKPERVPDGRFVPRPGDGGPRSAGARAAVERERTGGGHPLPPEQPQPQPQSQSPHQPQPAPAHHPATGPFATQPQPQPQPMPMPGTSGYAHPYAHGQAPGHPHGPAPDRGPGPVPLSGNAPGNAPGPGTAPHPPRDAWQQYDPWSVPLHGGPGVPPPAVRRGRRGPLVVGALALALVAGGVGGGIGAYVERNGGFHDIKLPQAGGEQGGRSPESVAGIAQTALPSVVTIHVRGNAEQGTGTGFVLDRQGHILTNNHVVEPAGTDGRISVTFSDGQTAKAKVIGKDGGYDLAVVQVQGVTGLRPLALGNSDSVRVGDPVVAIGAPYDLANTVTAGIISAKQRPITAGGEKGDGGEVSYVDALQTDAPINPGNSGGPLVDAKARVIGINSAIRAADTGGGLDDGSRGGQGGSIGLGFAIPINQAKRVAEELINTGRATHPVLGVTLEMEYDGDGARVGPQSTDDTPPVTPGGPGAQAGIRAGDVITKVDGAPVHSGEELIVKVRSHRPGDTLTLTLQRGGKEQAVELTLGSSAAG